MHDVVVQPLYISSVSYAYFLLQKAVIVRSLVPAMYLWYLVLPFLL